MVDPYQYPELVVAHTLKITEEVPGVRGFLRCEFQAHGNPVARVLIPIHVAMNAFREALAPPREPVE